MNEKSDRIQLEEQLTALLSKHGFKAVTEVLHQYAINGETELGQSEALSTCWETTAEKLEEIVKAWEKAEAETKP